MAISTQQLAQTIQTELGPRGARGFQEWLESTFAALEAITQKMDDDDGITDTDYEVTLNQFIKE